MLKDKELTSLHDSLFAKFKNYALSKEQMWQVRGGKTPAGSFSNIYGDVKMIVHYSQDEDNGDVLHEYYTHFEEILICGDQADDGSSSW